MAKIPTWLKPVATGVAIMIAAVLIAGMISVPFRASQPPHGADQPRLHWNTKNSTRFQGGTLAEVASRVGQAVYPATSPEGSPDAVILYNPENWQAGLAAASLLRPLNAILLPATGDYQAEIQRLRPAGSQTANGARVLALEGVGVAQGAGTAQTLNLADIYALRSQVGEPPQAAILANPNDPATALLAAPWAAFSGDMIVFNESDAPQGVQLYSLGRGIEAKNARRITGRTAFEVAVNFARYEDPENPLFGWGFNASSLTGYRAYTLARADDPGMALLSANLAVRGKPGPLLWSEESRLPQVINNYLWTQRAAFWVTPAEGPFHHFWILGDTTAISFPAQGQADYAVEIGPYLGKGQGMSGIDMLAAGWVVLGLASALWILFHQQKFLPGQMWVMKLAWPLLALMLGPFGIPLYYLAYNRPVLKHGKMTMWDRPLWLQGLAATASAVGFGAAIMIASGFITTFLGLPLIPGETPVLFLLGTPMILVMIINYVAAVLISWLLFQTPMLSMFYEMPYSQALSKSLPLVLASMTAAALAMNPGMWWLMMSKLPMMPSEESILWFGVMFFTAFLAFLLAWPLNYGLVRQIRKSGLM